MNFRTASALALGVLIGLGAVFGYHALPRRVAPDDARTCRLTLPALNAGARLELLRTAAGPMPGSIRIDYRAVEPEGRQRQRFVICRFAEGRAGRELTGLATEFGPMADASFYFLRRFYLDRRDPPPPDPAQP